MKRDANHLLRNVIRKPRRPSASGSLEAAGSTSSSKSSPKKIYVEGPVMDEARLSVRTQSRVLAFQSLYAYDHHPKQGKETVEVVFRMKHKTNEKLASRLVPFASELFEGTLERQVGIDALLRPKLRSWSWGRLSPTNKIILRMSVYSLLVQGLGKAIVIDEAVTLAKLFGASDDYKFINAVLDRISKEQKVEG